MINVNHNHTPAHGLKLAQAMAARTAQPGSVKIPEQSGPQYDFSAIFGQASRQASPGGAAASSASGSTAPTTVATTPATTTTSSTTTPVPVTPGPVEKPGIQALVTAIMNGTFKATNVTDPSKLQEVTPWMTDTMPSMYYASDETANQMAQLLGGKVVQMPAFGQNAGWKEPNANFIELPNGQTFNAADVAYYARCGGAGAAQLTANITQTINAGAAWANYYKHGGDLPSFSTGYVGAPIAGMDYPAGTIGADGNVINPAMQTSAT